MILPSADVSKAGISGIESSEQEKAFLRVPRVFIDEAISCVREHV
jgi:hypothetical protein